MPLKEEQIKVISHNDGSLLVSASAGSGKTFTMIERLKRIILEKKARLSEILAVTFTEKAAGEMKEKLLKALIKEINEGKTDLKEEIDEIQTADICTFHSFCGRLLRSNFYYADLSDDFEIIDSLESDRIKADVLDKVFEEEYEKNSENFRLLIARHSGKSRKDRELKNIILSVYSFLFSEADPISVLEKSKDIYTDSGFIEVKDKLNKLFHNKLFAVKESFLSLNEKISKLYISKYVAHINEFILDIDTFLKSDIYDIKEAEINKRLPFVKINADDIEMISLKEKLNNLKKKYYKIFDDLKDLTTEEEDKENFKKVRGHAVAFIELEKKFIEAYALEKQEENKLDFNDLEHFTLKVLKNNEVRKQIADKYKYIFADEYQDTSGVQEVILEEISNGNLYMVGDIKQSIYGFRGCNPQIFKEKQASMKDEEKSFLNYNFRSSDAIINGVNSVFDRIMTESTSGFDYKKDSDLISGGLYKQGDGRFKVLYYQKEKKSEEVNEEPRVYDIYEETKKSRIETEYLSGKIMAKIISDEIMEKFYDLETESYQNVRYGDIAILLRSMTNADKIVAELVKYGIPVASESKNDILEYKEIKIFIDILKILDNYRNEIPLVSVLKNVWEITDSELAEIKTNSNEYEKELKKNQSVQEFVPLKFYESVDLYIKKGNELSKKLEKFKKYIFKMRELSGCLSASEILDMIISDNYMEAKLFTFDYGKQKHKRLNRFLSESVVGGRKLSVREFLDRIENANGAFTMAEVGGDDAVKIMTIHASKGLEFPVVIVPLDNEFNFSDIKEDVIKDRNYGVIFKYYDEEKRIVKDTILRSYIKQIIKEDVVKEEMRLFYVAMTRAKYSLYLIGEENTSISGIDSFSVMTANKFSDFLPIDSSLYVFGKAYEKNNDKASKREIIIGKTDKKIISEIKKNLEFVYPYKSETVLPLKTSVTALLKSEKTFNEYLVPVISGETDAEKGTMIHKFLENYDFSNTLDEEYKRIIDSGIISADDEKNIDISKLRKILSADIFKKIRDYKLYREQSFIINIPANRVMDTDSTEEIMVQGVIDLLAVKDKNAIILDYKYSSKSKEALIKKYYKQLDIYRYAVTNSLKLKVEKTYIVSLLGAIVIEID